MNIVIAGELPLAEELLHRCMAAGHETSLTLVESLRDAAAVQGLLDGAAHADFAIECHNESKVAKRGLLELLAGARTVLVSALACSTTEAASWMPDPGRVVGWGALPPLGTGSMIEVAAGLQSTQDALAAADVFWQGLGLSVARVADGPGLVRARIVCALVNEAASALADGTASAEGIDTAMRLGTNYPRGPLAWGDEIGLDVVLGVVQGLQAEFGEDRYRPTPLLARYVQAGWLGRKTGRGFFEYP